MLMATNFITVAEGALYERKLFVHYREGHLLWQAGSPVVHRKHYSQPGMPDNQTAPVTPDLRLLSVFITCG